MLKAMGIEDEKVDQIIEAHAETVDALKAERDGYKEAASEVDGLKKELEKAKGGEDFKSKYEAERDAFAKYKDEVEKGRAEAEKAKAYREQVLGAAGIDERRFDGIMRLVDLSGVELKDGKVENADELAKAAAEEWSDFVVSKSTQGASVDEPPSNTGGGMTKEQILAIKNTSERQRAIAENLDLFG